MWRGKVVRCPRRYLPLVSRIISSLRMYEQFKIWCLLFLIRLWSSTNINIPDVVKAPIQLLWYHWRGDDHKWIWSNERNPFKGLGPFWRERLKAGENSLAGFDGLDCHFGERPICIRQQMVSISRGPGFNNHKEMNPRTNCMCLEESPAPPALTGTSGTARGGPGHRGPADLSLHPQKRWVIHLDGLKLLNVW